MFAIAPSAILFLVSFLITVFEPFFLILIYLYEYLVIAVVHMTTGKAIARDVDAHQLVDGILNAMIV